MTVDELNAITAQFGELFKQYLTNPIFRQNIDLLMKVSIQQKDTQNILTTLDLVAQKYQYELRNSEEPWKPNVLDPMSSIDAITTSPRKSFCRISDGEVEYMMGRPLSFEAYNPELAERLRQILADEQTDCYVGIQRNCWYREHFDWSNMSEHVKRWHLFISPRYRDYYKKYCNKNKLFIDTTFNRAFINGESQEYCEKFFAKWRSLFADKNVVIFSGEGVFKNIDHDIFSNAVSKEFVTCPSVNVYQVFDQIIDKALSYPKDYVLCFILGAVATVAAYDMSKHGYIAYDLGHLVKDYDMFMKKIDLSDDESKRKFYMPD